MLQRSRKKVWLKRLAILGTILVVLGFGVLETIRFVAKRRGVESVQLPPGSEILTLSVGADYTDAYRCPLHRPGLTLDHVLPPQAEGEIARTQNEVVYEGEAPGLRYLASYFLDPAEDAKCVTLSTVVFYKSPLGLLYFTPVKQVHRRLVPFAVSHWAKQWSTAE